MNVSFFTLSNWGKRGGIKEKVALGGWGGVWQTDIYFYAWKYKKPSWEVFVNCLQICITNWNANNNCTVCVTSRISESVLVRSIFYFWSSHKITSPIAQRVFFPVKFFRVSFLLVLITHFLFCFLFLFLIFLIYLLNHAIQSTYNAKTMSPSVCCAPAAQKNIKLCK